MSILVETEHKELVHTTGSIGIDLGIKDLCITSDGKIYENLKIIRKYEKQLVKLQRQLSHKEKRSKNYYKTKKKIALCHEKIRNTRKDYLHKVSHEIISENQVIVSENKAKWNGRKYIKIDTFYARGAFAYQMSFYPGMKAVDARTNRFTSKNWMDNCDSAFICGILEEHTGRI